MGPPAYLTRGPPGGPGASLFRQASLSRLLHGDVAGARRDDETAVGGVDREDGARDLAVSADPLALEQNFRREIAAVGLDEGLDVDAVADLDLRRVEVAEAVASRCMSLPIYPEMTDEQVRLVAATVREALVG